MTGQAAARIFQPRAAVTRESGVGPAAIGGLMRHFFHAAIAVTLVAGTIAPAAAAPADDATMAVTTALDKFNAGDVNAFIAAHRDGAVIIDEFAPYSWSGSGSAKSWIDSYAKDAAARGISDGRVDYAQPIQANSVGTSAYIVLPTIYSFKQSGKAMAGKGSMTFVMVKAGQDWKVTSWTYSGATPTPR